MCYSGKCRYEDHEGDCTIPWGTANYPDDALCVQNEREQIAEVIEGETCQLSFLEEG